MDYINLLHILAQSEGDSSGFITQLVLAAVTIVAVVAPLALIPWTFKWAGGVIGAIGSAASNWRSGIRQNMTRRAGEARAGRRERARSLQASSGRFGVQRAYNRVAQIAAGAPGIFPGGRARNTGVRFSRALENTKQLGTLGVNDHNALNALAVSGYDVRKAANLINTDSTLDSDEKARALGQINTARAVKGERRDLAAAAVIASASQGKASNAAVESLGNISDPSLRSHVLRQVQQAAGAAGQHEVYLGTGMNANGTVFGQDSAAGKDLFASKAHKLTSGDVSKMKTSTGKYMVEAIGNNAANYVEENPNDEEGLRARLSHLAELGSTVRLYGSGDDQEKLDAMLGKQGTGGLGDEVLDSRPETRQVTRKTQDAAGNEIEVTSTERTGREQPVTFRDLTNRGRRGDPLTMDQFGQGGHEEQQEE